MKNEATNRATADIANSSSTHNNINQLSSPDTRPRVRAAAGVRGSIHESALTVFGMWSRGKKTPLT